MDILEMLAYVLFFSGLINGVIFWKGFIRAGHSGWKAFVPIYGTLIQLKIIKKPWWWTILFWIPVVNIIMVIALIFNWLRLFGYDQKRYTLLSIITLGGFIIYLNHTKEFVEEIPPLNPKSFTAWLSSIMFAVVVATIVHNYFIQPYIIPTSSLEKTLLVGDFLFVSKFHYGARIPNTPLSFPMVHDTLPVIHKKSYLNIDALRLPYMRLPGFQKVKRNEIVVFSWPTDTVVKFFDRTSKIHVNKPIDKKSNYVKRCVGMPGDTLEVREGYVYINGKQNQLPERAKLQFSYNVETTANGRLNPKMMYKKYDVTEDIIEYKKNIYLCKGLTEDVATSLKKGASILQVKRRILPKGIYDETVFPHHPELSWNQDQFGPILLPKRGMNIPLSIENLPIYKRAIEVYEHHDIKTVGTQISIDGQIVDHYTFEQDYYWMMGDNRHLSEDSRYWGMVPEDHIVGKPIFIWMSLDWRGDGVKVRWDRVFTTIGGEGKPISFFRYFVIIAIGWYAFSYFRKKKKKKKS